MAKSVGAAASQGVDPVPKDAAPDAAAARLDATASLNTAIFHDISVYNCTLYALLYTFRNK